MKAYKVEILIVDHDELGAREIKEILENNRYPNHCMSPVVMEITGKDVGDDDDFDDHPLNKTATMKEEYKRLFG
jgi:hypothetical protein